MTREQRRVARHFRRCLHLTIALLALIVALPLLIVIAGAIRVTLGRPVLFRQERTGRGGRPFVLVKFRTMREPRPGEDDPDRDADRLGRLGRFLRATSLDELPTLWNVVKGDMALVGPRPLPVRYLRRYSPFQARRHEVEPGITGWAQVNGRNTLSWDDKLALDVWYVDNQSLLLDCRILLATLGIVLRRQGITQANHPSMPEFEGAGDLRRP